MKRMVEGRNRNKQQEAQNWTNQEPKPGTLFLVGSWLWPYNFGFSLSLHQNIAKNLHPKNLSTIYKQKKGKTAQKSF